MGGPGVGVVKGALGCAFALAAWLGAPPCRADAAPLTDRGVGRIEVVRRPGASDCPDALTLSALVAKASGRDAADYASDANHTVRFDVVFDRGEAGYIGTVHVSGALHGVRTLTSPESTCTTLAEAFAVTLTILLDSARGSVEPAEPPAPEPAPPKPPSPPPALASTSQTAFDDAPPPGVVDGPLSALGKEPAQTPRRAKTSLFLELGGPAIFYSLNYERFFGDDVSLRLGVGFVSGSSLDEWDPNSAWAVSVPFVASIFPVGSDSHKFQMGLGGSLLYLTGRMKNSWSSPDIEQLAPNPGARLFGTFVIGYRYVPKDGGPSVGIALTPIFNTMVFTPWVAFDIGLTL
jgi:hypothetical protein